MISNIRAEAFVRCRQGKMVVAPLAPVYSSIGSYMRKNTEGIKSRGKENW